MSQRARSRGRGFGRAKLFDQHGSEHYSHGRGFRGRGAFYMQNQTPSHAFPPQRLESPNFDCIGLKEERTSTTSQPIFTPQPKLDPRTQNFMTNLQHVWSLWKKSDNVSRMLQEYLSVVENPYETAFKVAVTCPDFYQGKPMSLPVAVIEELAIFLKNKKDKYAPCLTHSIKIDVFKLFTKQRNSLLTKLAFGAYELAADRNMFIQPIQELMRNRQYKEASLAATFLSLDQFPIEDFVIPLLFQDKLTIVEDYLRISRPAQIATAEYLDRLLVGRVSVHIDEVIRRLQIPDIKPEKLQYKPMSKLLARFQKIFNLPPSSCPNLTKKKRESTLHYVVRKRYKYDEINGECWREMAHEVANGDQYLEEELVQQICLQGDIEEAAYFAIQFNIPYSRLPYNVVVYLRTGRAPAFRGFSPRQGSLKKESKPKKLMRLPDDHLVTMVDSDAGLQHCVEVVARMGVVGLDAEWKPILYTEPDVVSLLQISTHHETFLIDVTATQNSALWKDLSRVLFTNTDILKLGFGLTADMVKLKQTVFLNDLKVVGLGYLDLNVLWKKIMREFNVTLPFKGDESEGVEGLSKLVSLCLGVSLDKSEQFSNWARRPLRDAQKSYAALDSYCLLEVYKVLCTECTNQGVPFPDVCHDLMVASANTTKKPKKKSPQVKVAKAEKSPSPNLQPIRVQDLSVVCDTMLQGLGRHLRSVGVNAEILTNTQNHNVCVAMCVQENRVILTKGSVYNRLAPQVPSGMCYLVEKSTAKDQLVEVLNYYNVVVSKEDVFSRCQHCNGADFKKLTPQELKRAIDSTHRTTHMMSNHALDIAEDDEGDYNGFTDEDEYSDDDLPGPPNISVPSSGYTQLSEPAVPEQDEEEIYGYNCQTSSGSHIKHECIPKEVFNKVPVYNICDKCGHCYWDGSHLERVLGGKLKNIVDK